MAHIIDAKLIHMFTLIKDDHEKVTEWCTQTLKGNWQEFALGDNEGHFVILIENDIDARLFDARWRM